MTKPPSKPSNSRKGKKSNFPPPVAINIVRFSRSIWPEPEQDGQLCDAITEAAFITIGAVPDSELHRAKFRALLARAYEELKAP